MTPSLLLRRSCSDPPGMVLYYQWGDQAHGEHTMREKLHDVIHYVTGEILLEECWPVDVAIFLKRNPDLSLHHVDQNEPTQRMPDGGKVDDVWVNGGWDPNTVGLYV